MSTEQVMQMTPSIPPDTVGDRMRRALRKENISVQEMAEYLGVSRNTVGTWINDHIRPSEQTFKLWAMRTGVPLDWLKEGTSFHAPPARGDQHDRRTRRNITPQKSPRRTVTRPSWLGAAA